MTRINKNEIQDMLDQGRGYKVNPDGSVTITEYQPGMVAYIAGALGWAQTGCDHTVSILEGLTGPPGKLVSYGYTFIKDVGGEISTAIAKGKSVTDGLKTGALKGVYDIGVSYVGGKIFDKIGLGTPDAPDLSKVNVGSVVSIMTGNATTQLKKEVGFKKVMENNGKKLVKAVFVGQGEGQIKAASSKQLMNTIVANSIKGDITGTISGAAGDAGWDAMNNND